MHGSRFLLRPILTDLLALGAILPIDISFIPMMPLWGCAPLNSYIGSSGDGTMV